jgi:drug/metabolite transporter (DMT)-like permease
MLSAALAVRGDRLPRPGSWPALAVLGFLAVGIGNGGVVWAEQTVPSGLAAVLVAAVPFWMVGVERLRSGHERLPTRKIVGLCVGFAGIVLLVWPELHLEGSPGFLHGVMATQLACVGWAIASSYTRQRKDESILGGAALQMLFAGMVLLGVGLAAGEWDRLAFSHRTLSALLYLIGVGSILGFSAYTYALMHLPTATVSLYAYVNPIIAVVLGSVLLSEPLTPRIAVAGGVVLTGMWLVSSARGR